VCAIAALAMTLDTCLVAIGYLAYLGWLSILWLAAELVALAGLAGAGLCHLLVVLLRLLATPGDAIRGARAPMRAV
jgi:hypothetical protein